jgi:colanic acid/amylovoran/stewartan biosynthesis glycosyltransferase WcaL/AmsK/CpsK
VENRSIVAHVNLRFFERTQTFVYLYISNLRRVRPICLSVAPFINLDLFSFPRQDLYQVGLGPESLRWLSASAIGKVIGRRILAERVLRRRGSRVIHAHFGPTGWWSLLLKRRLGLPLITTFYGYDTARDLHQLGLDWSGCRQELFEEGDLFLVEGLFMKQQLVDLGCPPGKIQLQRLAIDLHSIPYRLRKPNTDGKVSIIFVGRFVEKKGLLYALHAVRDAQLRNEFDLEFRIIGDGPLAGQVRAFIKANKMENRVRLLGALSYQDCLREIQHADLMLQPSVTAANGDNEGGAPTVILEGQASGMPIVSTYHADIPYVVAPGKSAVLVPERDQKALGDALVYLLGHPAAWEEMGRAGRDHVQKFHSIELEAAALEDKYLKLLAPSE